MLKRVKLYFFNVIISVVIIFFTLLLSNGVVIELIENNNFFMQHIEKIKSHDNILDKCLILLQKDAKILIKKYFVAVVDSFIEFDQLPSFDDVKYFFGLIIYSLENNIEIQEIEIYNNRVILLCTSNDVGRIDHFIKVVQDISYIDDIFYKGYNTINDNYKVKIYCIHNEK